MSRSDPSQSEFRGFVLLFAVLLALIVSVPYLAPIRGGRMLLPFIGIAIPLVAIRSVADRSRHLWIAIVLAALSVIASLLNLDSVDPSGLAILAPLLFFAFATLIIGIRVFSQETVNAEVLAAAACAYLILAMTFWFGYLAVESFFPGSFGGLSPRGAEGSRTDLLYFSFVTQTTLGYGDIVPVSAYARSLVSVHAVLGILFPAVLIARLVGLYGKVESDR